MYSSTSFSGGHVYLVRLFAGGSFDSFLLLRRFPFPLSLPIATDSNINVKATSSDDLDGAKYAYALIQ